MQNEVSFWKTDFEKFCTNKACGIISKFTYGRNVYTSPRIHKKIWYVFEYKGEYNVFLDRDCFNSRKISKDLVASFKIKETAIAFALRALLISVGYVNRFGMKK